jgi:hypothetical protein
MKMNKVAQTIRVIGILALVGGFLIGFLTFEQPVPGYTHLTEADWSVFWTWSLYGAFACIIMFGFSEIINLLDKIYKELKGEKTVAKEE